MKRYVYRQNPETGEIESIRVDRDWTDAPKSTGDLGKFQYGVRMTDGTPIDSRSQYERYLKEKGVAPVSDFTETWARNRERAASGYEAPEARRERREQVGRAMYQLETKRGRK